jgi:hypothetical protein
VNPQKPEEFKIEIKTRIRLESINFTANLDKFIIELAELFGQEF